MHQFKSSQILSEPLPNLIWNFLYCHYHNK